jgi:2-polyprenyl-6-methoxyphenol hydroxylase-like FAD-dependent oxidoreductase
MSIKGTVMQKPHALVIGGSLGGLIVARLLLGQGWAVSIFERSRSDLASRGAGLGSQPALFEVLRRLKLQFDESIALEIRSRACLGPDGATICQVPVREVSTAWDVIYRLLRKDLPDSMYRGGTTLVRFETTNDQIEAIFADGSRSCGDLLIGADGVHSTVRRQLVADAAPAYAGYVSWRGLIAQNDIPTAFRDCLLSRMNFCFPDGEMALTVPVPDSLSTASSQLRCQFSWFRPVSRSELTEELYDDNDLRPSGTSVSPLRIPPALVQQLKVRAAEILPPQVALLIERAAHPLLQPIFDYETPHMASGRVVLLGDAAFIARPHVGTGVTKAALDAVALADALAQDGSDVPGALMRYEQDRIPAGRQLVARGRALGAYLSAQLCPHDQREVSGLYRDPERYMRTFGSGGEHAFTG